MSRILLVCPEPLGHRHPAGVGIRFLEFARALRAAGHHLTVLSPDGGAIEGCTTAQISPSALRDASAWADAAIVQGHVANDFFAHAHRIPTVVDLYDPFIVENLSYHRSLGSEVYDHDHATLMRSIEQGDFFLCASEPQRMFYLGLLLGARRLNAAAWSMDPRLEQLVDIVPFGVPPPRALAKRNPLQASVLFGGIYDWYDPVTAIEAAAIAREHLDRLTLTFTSHPNPETTPQGMAAVAREHVRNRGFGSFVKFEPWVAYEDRGAFYDRFSAALLTFPSSIETDLAMRTRIFDDLWAGIPVVSSPAAGTDALIEHYGAGRVVHSAEPAAYAQALAGLLSDRAAWDAAVDGTQRYTAEHGWSRLLAPLLAFCEAPRLDATRPKPGASPAKSHSKPFLRRVRDRIGGSR